jgi:hypothetical protein
MGVGEGRVMRDVEGQAVGEGLWARPDWHSLGQSCSAKRQLFFCSQEAGSRQFLPVVFPTSSKGGGLR